MTISSAPEGRGFRMARREGCNRAPAPHVAGMHPRGTEAITRRRAFAQRAGRRERVAGCRGTTACLRARLVGGDGLALTECGFSSRCATGRFYQARDVGQ